MSATTKTITVINCDLCGDEIHMDDLSRMTLATPTTELLRMDLCRHCCTEIQETIRKLRVTP